MKFLTRERMEGSEEKFRKTIDSYNNYLSASAGKMPSEVYRLATEPNFHDGLVVFVRGEKSNLSIKYLIGDLQVGYGELTVNYTKDDARFFDIENFREIVLNPQSEILASEIICGDDLGYSQFLLFAPDGEAQIDFDDVHFAFHRRADRNIEFLGDRFTVVV